MIIIIRDEYTDPKKVIVFHKMTSMHKSLSQRTVPVSIQNLI